MNEEVKQYTAGVISADRDMSGMSAIEVGLNARQGLKGRGVFLTGYSDAPEGFYEPALKFVEQRLGSAESFVITSLTVTCSSIDAISTIAAHKLDLQTIYFTATDYMPYVKPEEFPADVNRTRFDAAQKIVFDDKAMYSQASAAACDEIWVMGGRAVAVSDFVNAVKLGKQVKLVINDEMAGGWNEKRKQPEYAPQFIRDTLARLAKGEDPIHEVGGLDKNFFKQYRKALKRLIKVVDINDPLGAGKPTDHVEFIGTYNALKSQKGVVGAAIAAIRVKIDAISRRQRERDNRNDYHMA